MAYYIWDNQHNMNMIDKYGYFETQKEAIIIMGKCLLQQVIDDNGGFRFESIPDIESQLFFKNEKPTKKTYTYLLDYFEYKIKRT